MDLRLHDWPFPIVGSEIGMELRQVGLLHLVRIECWIRDLFFLNPIATRRPTSLVKHPQIGAIDELSANLDHDLTVSSFPNSIFSPRNSSIVQKWHLIETHDGEQETLWALLNQ